MAKYDPELSVHRDWMGLLQPVGLVVSPPALVKAQAVPNQNVAELQQRLLSIVENPPEAAGGDDEPVIRDLALFFQSVLGWSLEDIAGVAGGPPIPDALELVLPDYNETLRPTYAVVDSMGDGGQLMLVQVLSRGTQLDEAPEEEGKTGWSASPQAKLERLLREVKIPIGLLCNGDALRLVYAPSGESSGHLTFPISAMCEVAGRPILAALHMLLSEHRVFSATDGRRLHDILIENRKHQAEVSNALSDQVLGALWELLRGFQAADPEDGRRIFDETAREDPEHVYGGQLTLLMRLIFVLYAEDEGLMPAGEVYANNYSIAGLYDRLRSDAARYPDTMDQRYGAYAWLLSLFRLIFDGGGHQGLQLPARHGQLFNPDEFPFLEGRPLQMMRVTDEKFEAPRVSDGCIYRVLDALLLLGGERLSYRALDVEQVGSVYEAMMGYEVERAAGHSIAVRPKHVVVDVDALLKVDEAKRNKWLKDQSDCDLTAASIKTLKDAISAEDVVAALGSRVSPRSLDAAGTPRSMAPGALYLQPGEERRRSGSHYTPRELTQPIVQTTLRPVLAALGERPTPQQILALKVCDPAMGSGAFLVETCRQLAEHLVAAWETFDVTPEMPPDEEPLLHARRLVAQRCLYGVDKNPFAVNLAKLSIWLVTLAKDHAFTFVDHALKHGDSLVGLTRKQISAFHWKTDTSPALDLFEEKLKQDIEEALGWRDALQGLDEGDYNQKKEAWWEAENALGDARLIGDLVIAAFFGAEKDSDREELRSRYRSKVEVWQANATDRHVVENIVEELRCGEKPLPPIHWEIEFPEVFGRENAGFDAILGNPPFLGGKKVSTAFGDSYSAYLHQAWDFTTKNVDLCGRFHLRAAELARQQSYYGLVSTENVLAGESKTRCLDVLSDRSGTFIETRRGITWPGEAALEVCILFFKVQTPTVSKEEKLSEPQPLDANADMCYVGCAIQGMGFLVTPDLAARLPESERAQVVRPFLVSDDLNTHPQSLAAREIVFFAGMDLQGAECHPTALEHVRQNVKPYRETVKRKAHRERWWRYGDWRPGLYAAIGDLTSVIAVGITSKHMTFNLVNSQTVFDQTTVIFADARWQLFGVLCSSIHGIWARNLGAKMGKSPRYNPSRCFSTFPFPDDWEVDPALETTGESYYQFRADLMAREDEGLTKSYNRFHDPEERNPDMLEFRRLHVALDRVLLDSYGWDDIPCDCEFLLDYEIDEETWGNKKKPYRFRWPESVHDEVLARLLDLNQKRYAEEVSVGLHAEKGAKKTALKKKAPSTLIDIQPSLGVVMNRTTDARS